MTIAARRHRSVVVMAGSGPADEAHPMALARSLGKAGVETVYLGQQQSARQIAAAVADTQADAVELCLTGRGGVPLLRELLRELSSRGRRDVSIVLHKVNTGVTEASP